MFFNGAMFAKFWVMRIKAAWEPKSCYQSVVVFIVSIMCAIQESCYESGTSESVKKHIITKMEDVTLSKNHVSKNVTCDMVSIPLANLRSDLKMTIGQIQLNI